MKASLMTSYGNVEKSLSFVEDYEIPQITEPNQVQIKLAYASINPVDYKIRKGALRPFMPKKFPYILGRDGCGVITKVGNSITKFKVGDRVMGVFSSNGSHAQYLVCEEKDICIIPEGMEDQFAGALPLVAQTAIQMFTVSAEYSRAVKENTIGTMKNVRILVLGASGGCGTLATIFAKHFFGAHVYAVCSAKNVEYVRQLGADQVIDYTSQKFVDIIPQEEKKRGREHAPYVDFVLDCVGVPHNQTDAFSIMDSTGIYSTIAVPKEAEERNFGALASLVGAVMWSKVKHYAGKAPRLVSVLTREDGDELGQIMQFLQKNNLTRLLRLDEFELKDINEAHKQIETGRTVGKITIHIPQ
jgi:NADPH:quinone reductase-like Zn-dependent oxidoreductase